MIPFRLKNPLLALTGDRRPLYVAFGVTHRCNIHCRMCNLWKDGDRKGEMDLDRIHKWAEWFEKIGLTTISVGGGEPFLRSDLPEVVGTFSGRGIRVRLVTNGIAPTEEMIRAVRRAGARDVSISLDSLDPKTHDYICNRKGAWERTIENISHFVNTFNRRGSILMLNTVISRLNLKEIPGIVNFAREAGLFISLVPVHLAAEGVDDLFLAHAPEFSLKGEDIPGLEAVYEGLLALKRGRYDNIFNSTLFIEESLRFLRGERPRWECDAGTLYLSLSPRGEISACHRFRGVGVEDYRDLTRFLHRMKGGEGELLRRGCDGCLRPCWAEISIFFRDRRAFRENLGLQLASHTRRRRRLSPFEVMEMAKKWRGGKEFQDGQR